MRIRARLARLEEMSAHLRVFKVLGRWLTISFAVATSVGVATTDAGAQGYWHPGGSSGLPTFGDPISACTYDFADAYLPTYSTHRLRSVEPRITSSNVFVGVDCLFYHPVRVPHNLHGYATIVCPSGYLRLQTAPWCQLPDEPAGAPSPNQCSGRPRHQRGNPIDVVSGAKIQQTLDFSTADHRLYFARTYSSEYRRATPLGMSWVSNFDRIFSRPLSNGVSVYIYLGDGRVAQFNLSSGVWRPSIPKMSVGQWTGEWTATSTSYRKDVSWSLAQVGTGWRFIDEDGRIENYDSNYRITSIQFPGGYTWTYTYNAAGQYTSVTDSLGRSVLLAYRANGLLDSVTAPDGKQYAFDYDQSLYFDPTLGAPDYGTMFARLIRVIYPDATAATDDNPTTTYVYEDSSQPNALTGVIDERGIRIRTWAYDSSGRGVLSELAGGLNPYSLAYNTTTNTTTVTNPFGRVETFSTPPSSQNLRRYTQVSGAATAHVAASTTSYGYDANNFLNQLTDPEGRVTTFVRDARGLETSRTEGTGSPLVQTISTSWHATYPFPTQVVEPGLTKNATYDTNGNLTQLQLIDTTSQSIPYSTNGQQRTWTYTYTAAGLLDTVDGPLAGSGDLTDYAYDAQGNLASVTDALGNVTSIASVDGSGRPLSIIDPNGIETMIAYSPRGWVTGITVNPGPGQRQTTLAYDEAGHLTQVTLPSGGTLHYTYDAAERVTEVRNNFNESMTFSYNTAGQVVQREYRTSGGTLRDSLSFVYDEAGRLMQAIGAAAQTETRAYDRTNNLVSVTDPRAGIWATSYDALNRVMSATNPESESLQYGYDGRHKLVSQTDGRSLQTSYIRNGFGDVIREVSPDRSITTYWYDAAGNVTSMIDAENVETSFSYDNAYRLTQKAFPSDPSLNQAFTYDDTTGGNHGRGRLTGASDNLGLRAFVYDELGQVTRETRTINGHLYQTDYTYSPNGGVEQITYPTGRQVRYVRDLQDRIIGVDTRESASLGWSSVASNVAWRPFGPFEGLDYGNGLHLALGYDQNYWLTSIAVTGGSTATLDLTFGRDAAGAVTTMTDAVSAARSASYTYRPSGRLESATSGALTTSWTYDAAGNRTRETRASGTTTYDDYTYSSTSNRLTEIRDQNGVLLRDFLYRLNGQVSTDTRAGAGVFEYDYDANSRLSQVRSNGSVIATYGYDAAGRRIAREVTGLPGVSREYLYLPDGRLLAEADGTGNIVREHIWLDDLPLAAVDVSGSGTTLYYIHAGHRGEPLAMTDGSKAKAWDASVSPFGAATIFTATTPLDLRLPGQQLQAETGLHQNWMRDYDPALGRYLQPDPIGLAGGPNVYSYVGQDPINYVDPEGKWAWIVIGGIIGGGGELYSQLQGETSLGDVNWGRVGTATLTGAAFGWAGGAVGGWVARVPLSPGARAGLGTYLAAHLGTMKGMIDLLVNPPNPCSGENGGVHILNSALRSSAIGFFGQLFRR